MAVEEKTIQNVFTTTIVTPDGQVLDNPNIDLAVLKTTDGEIGIMANRLALVAALKISEARFHDGNKVETFAINGGFAEFSNNQLTIVSPSAENAKNIDVHRAELAKQRAEQSAKSAKSADDRRRAEIALARAINRINTSKN